MKYNHAIARMGAMTPARRKLHKGTEALAVFAIAPFLIAAGLTKKPLPPAAKGALVALGVGTIVVDGYLLSKWQNEKRERHDR